jgi:predicted permease
VVLSNDMFTAPVFIVLKGIDAAICHNRLHLEMDELIERFALTSIEKMGLGLLMNPSIIGYICGFLWAGLRVTAPLAIDEGMKYLSEATMLLRR